MGTGFQFGLGLAGDIAGAAMSKRAAQRQMDFQREMSNTQHQKAAKDLEAAGLNRILALGRPAAAMSGAAPSFGSLTKTASSAVAAGRQQKELNQLGVSKRQTDRVQRGLMGEQTLAVGAQREAHSAKAALDRQLALQSVAETANKTADHLRIKALTGKTNAERRSAEVQAESWEALGPDVVSAIKLGGLLGVGFTGAGMGARLFQMGHKAYKSYKAGKAVSRMAPDVRRIHQARRADGTIKINAPKPPKVERHSGKKSTKRTPN